MNRLDICIFLLGQQKMYFLVCQRILVITLRVHETEKAEHRGCWGDVLVGRKHTRVFPGDCARGHAFKWFRRNFLLSVLPIV